jgi:DNA repair protein SbcC/Rad50
LREELKMLPEYDSQRRVLHSQIQEAAIAQQRESQLAAEINLLRQQLADKNYGIECGEQQAELARIEQRLNQINYDEKNYALARGEVDRWRWAEVKAAELKNAQRQADQISSQLPELNQQIQQLSDRLTHQQIAPEIQQQLSQTDQAIASLSYDPVQHQQIRQAKEQATPALLHYQELRQAQQQFPVIEQQYLHLQQLQGDRQAELNLLQLEMAELQQLLQQNLDQTERISQTQTQITNLQAQIEAAIAKIAQLQQAQQQLQALAQQQTTITSQLAKTLHQQRLHQELQQAFGKNGIQALMIETILPQIEAEANQILGQLSDYQFNVRFITQKARKGNGSNNSKVIDTLEIEIADRQGTRPYETYSGGEAFRINFAIRLALSRILAQRTGGKLQTLIIDEGFGSQDAEGCDRLVAAINAIAPDFECILVITHMPQLKEAFTTLIEVAKTANGSKVRLLT